MADEAAKANGASDAGAADAVAPNAGATLDLAAMPWLCSQDSSTANCQLAHANVGSALTRTEQTAEIGLTEFAHLHAVANGVDRVRRIDRPMLPFVVLDHPRQQVAAS